MVIAKTEASGGKQLLGEVLEFTSSLALDRDLLKEDLVGSLAHLTMLAKKKIVPREAARAIQRELCALWPDAQGQSPVLAARGEEDIHMTIEAHLAQALGETAGLLHSARSRNDQVALDLHLRVRQEASAICALIAHLITDLVARAHAEGDMLLPAYTHRQRAQPITLAYWLAAYATMFLRDIETFGFALEQADASPLGVGAIAGTSLATDREMVRELLGFSRLTQNGLDTVGDRDFVLDYLYAAAKFLTHTSRLATDVIDFSTSEFRFVTLDGEIACGSSMMPQKRNPDVFELVRGKTGRGVGQLMQMFVTLKGLAGGYNRDLQEDRASVLSTGPLVRDVAGVLRVALPRVHFNREAMRQALERDYTQATDIAEALVKKGMTFRIAYDKVGRLVAACQQAGLPLAGASVDFAQKIDAAFNAEVLALVDVGRGAAGRESAGGTGSGAVAKQLAALSERASQTLAEMRQVVSLEELFERLRVPL